MATLRYPIQLIQLPWAPSHFSYDAKRGVTHWGGSYLCRKRCPARAPPRRRPRLNPTKSTVVVAGTIAMLVLVVLARFAIAIPLVGTVSWGPFVVALTFVVSMLVTYFAGVKQAIVLGLLGAAALTGLLAQTGASPRVLIAAFVAFLLGQTAASVVVDRRRNAKPFLAALMAGICAGIVNGGLYQLITNAGTTSPWVTSMLTDAGLKVVLAFALALVFKVTARAVRAQEREHSAQIG
jgi:hypothetical protein